MTLKQAQRIAYAIAVRLIDQARLSGTIGSEELVENPDLRPAIEQALLEIRDELLTKAASDDDVEEWEIEALDSAIAPYVDPQTGKLSLALLKADSRPLSGKMLDEFNAAAQDDDFRLPYGDRPRATFD